MQPAFDDKAWSDVNLPHDWSIEGPLGPEYASGTGYAPGGIGWYRKHFRLDPPAGKLAAIEFDGVYDHSEVWFNGQLVGGRPYGIRVLNATHSVPRFGNADNVIAVRVDHSRFADSRWYTGSGIYRHVHLRFTDPLRISPHGLHDASGNAGVGHRELNTTIENGSNEDRRVLAPIGRPAARRRRRARRHARQRPGRHQPHSRRRIDVAHPECWSTDTPVSTSFALRSRAGSDVADKLPPRSASARLRSIQTRASTQRQADQAQGRLHPPRRRLPGRRGAGPYANGGCAC